MDCSTPLDVLPLPPEPKRYAMGELPREVVEPLCLLDELPPELWIAIDKFLFPLASIERRRTVPEEWKHAAQFRKASRATRALLPALEKVVPRSHYSWWLWRAFYRIVMYTPLSSKASEWCESGCFTEYNDTKRAYGVQRARRQFAQLKSLMRLTIMPTMIEDPTRSIIPIEVFGEVAIIFSKHTLAFYRIRWSEYNSLQQDSTICTLLFDIYEEAPEQFFMIDVGRGRDVETGLCLQSKGERDEDIVARRQALPYIWDSFKRECGSDKIPVHQFAMTEHPPYPGFYWTAISWNLLKLESDLLKLESDFEIEAESGERNDQPSIALFSGNGNHIPSPPSFVL